MQKETGKTKKPAEKGFKRKGEGYYFWKERAFPYLFPDPAGRSCCCIWWKWTWENIGFVDPDTAELEWDKFYHRYKRRYL